MTLKKYKQKRDFKKTPEPAGKVTSKKNTKLLYIIQKHAASHLHYDFRLELEGVLLSWAVPKGPSLDPNVKRLAMHVEDHPIAYGSFEGIIPKGQYGGGTVMLWDRGIWVPEDEDPIAAYRKGSLKFSLQGEKLQGLWKLFRINHNDKTWLLVKAKDEHSKLAKKYDITVEEATSVLTNQTMDEITQNYSHVWGKTGRKKAKAPGLKLPANLKARPFPKKISAELATLVDKPPKGDKWLSEIKFDGYRLLALKKNDKTKLMTRNHNDWTTKFKSIAEAVNKLPISNIILDGEIVVLNKENKSDFQALQNSIKTQKGNPFIYYVFDLLYYDQYDLMPLALLERKTLLQQILNKKDSSIRYSDHVVGSAQKVFDKAAELGLEGIIAKDSQAAYEQKRSSAWVKIKCIKRQEFLIGGFTQPQGSRKHLGALLIGTHDEAGNLIYNGNVGTGFTIASLKTLYKLLQAHVSTSNPFHSVPPKSKNVTWINPVLVAEVAFTEWTKEGLLRHPSFQGLREDKKPNQVIKETVQSTYKLTNPHKILYSEDRITKKDIADYYDTIQEWILPYVVNRPLTLVRCPENYNACFYQKHITDSLPPDLHGFLIKEKTTKANCIYIKDGKGLMALPQIGVLEIHPWGSQIDHVESPDMLIFDLDPAPDVTWKAVVQAALLIKEKLAQLKLISFVKTTGGKGLHVVVPIKPRHDWTDIKAFSHAFVDCIVAENPKKYLSKMTKSERKGKIFLDYLRNQRGATAVAAFSTRARLHAPVSTPLHWDELTAKREDTFFTIKTLPERLIQLKNDPWQDFFKVKQMLGAMKKNE